MVNFPCPGVATCALPFFEPSMGSVVPLLRTRGSLQCLGHRKRLGGSSLRLEAGGPANLHRPGAPCCGGCRHGSLFGRPQTCIEPGGVAMAPFWGAAMAPLKALGRPKRCRSDSTSYRLRGTSCNMNFHMKHKLRDGFVCDGMPHTVTYKAVKTAVQRAC